MNCVYLRESEASHDIDGSNNGSFMWTDELAKQMVEMLLDYR